MKRVFYLFAGLLVAALTYQYVSAQQPDEDYAQNLELMNRIGDTYVVQDCTWAKKPTPAYLLPEPILECSGQIVPGTLNAHICVLSYFILTGDEDKCCYKTN